MRRVISGSLPKPTSIPSSASAAARPDAMVVLPSPAIALVTPRTGYCRACKPSSTRVYRLRNEETRNSSGAMDEGRRAVLRTADIVGMINLILLGYGGGI